MKEVFGKFLKMRKPQGFVVYPISKESPDIIIVQSDKSIGSFDKTTGKGVLNTKGAYFYHLQSGQLFTFPPDFVKECVEVQPHPGDKIGPGIYVG